MSFRSDSTSELITTRGEPPSCSRCNERPTIIYKKYSGERLCKRCFVESFELRVYRTITRYKMFRVDDRILVAVSGGKDSLSLLHVLSKLEARFPKSELLAVTIDEGISGYREEAVEIARRFCRQLGVEHHVFTFKELYNCTMEDVVAKGYAKSIGLKACSICGVLRRHALNLAARLLGATVIATAHTLDDVVQTYFMNLLRGDKLDVTLCERREGNGVIPRVSPFKLTPQNEVVLYAYLNKIPFQEVPCPNASSSQRELVRNFLSKFEDTYPGSLFTALRAIEELITNQVSSKEGQRTCDLCGQPSSRAVCRACEIVEVIGLVTNVQYRAT